MPTLADSLVSSSARPLAIRRRPDLQVTKQRYQGRQYWVVKDPVGLNYFRFQEEEFTLLNWLDGENEPRRSAQSLRGPICAAKDHARRARPLDRHAAPKRPGDRRRAGPRQAASQAPLGTKEKGVHAAPCRIFWPFDSKGSTPNGSQLALLLRRFAGFSPKPLHFSVCAFCSLP